MNSKAVSRRQFIKISGTTACASIATGLPIVHATPTEAQIGCTTLPYPSIVVAQASQLKDNTPVTFNFPDQFSPCVLIKMGHRIPGGVGPQNDIVAFNSLCTHQGCPLAYDKEARIFKCGCHFTTFDAEKGGQMICGQATENLPQIVLEYIPKDDSIRAVAVQGLIYGRQANLL
jgi:arsenite oxidase small subunit